MTQPQNNADYDPLASALKRPAVSFKETPVNQVRRLTVQSLAREAQTTVFGSNGELAFWPAGPDGTRNPKMAVVYDVDDDTPDENGQTEHALWAPKPSSLLTALAKAQQESGVRIQPGSVLEVYITGTKPSGKGNDQKLYKAKHTPPAAGSQPDPLTSGAPAAPAPQGSVAGTSQDPWSAPPASSSEPPF